MKARALFALMVGLYLLALSTLASAQKLKLGGGLKLSPPFFLTVYAAEEKGFFKENGLEVEGIAFESGSALAKAVAAKALFFGLEGGLSPIQAIARGLPAKLISDLDRAVGFNLWVLAKSPVKDPKDFKGRIGVTALGAAAHAYAQILVKRLGIEKDVKFVGTGGAGPVVAALKVGAIDATVMSFDPLAELKTKGEVRDIVSMDEYLPQPWLGRVVWAHKEFIREKPEITRRTVRAILQATRFWKKDSTWALASIRKEAGISEEAAREIYKNLRPTEDGRVERKALENARDFLIEYKIIDREKAPPVDELYTDEFVRPR